MVLLDFGFEAYLKGGSNPVVGHLPILIEDAIAGSKTNFDL
jgi:hypothetical protein